MCVRHCWQPLGRLSGGMTKDQPLLGIFLIVVASLSREQPQVPRAAALVIAPQGVLVDQLTGDPFERALARARGAGLQETLLKDLIDAVRASIAVPGLFTPAERDGRLLVDGGLVNPVPVSLCRAMGADLVIGAVLPLL